MDDEDIAIIESEKRENNSSSKDDILIAFYKIVAEQKRHYDTIAWALTGICIPLALYIVFFSFQLCPAKFHEFKYGLGFIGIYILLFWLLTYDRFVKSGKLDRDVLLKIERELDHEIKPQHYHERNMNRMSSWKKWNGTGDLTSTWAMRWMILYSYVMCWFVVWNFHDFAALSIITFFSIPLIWIFILNLLDLTESKSITAKRPPNPTPVYFFLKAINELIWENKRLAMVTHSLIWLGLWSLILNPMGIGPVSITKTFFLMIKNVLQFLVT